jgi:hypothetical protein
VKIFVKRKVLLIFLLLFLYRKIKDTTKESENMASRKRPHEPATNGLNQFMQDIAIKNSDSSSIPDSFKCTMSKPVSTEEFSLSLLYTHSEIILLHNERKWNFLHRKLEHRYVTYLLVIRNRTMILPYSDFILELHHICVIKFRFKVYALITWRN